MAETLALLYPAKTPQTGWRERHEYRVVRFASRPAPFFAFPFEGSASSGTLRSGLFSLIHKKPDKARPLTLMTQPGFRQPLGG